MLKKPDCSALVSLDDAVDAEIAYLRSLGDDANLIAVCSNLGAYEAVLHILRHREAGLPVYTAIETTSTRFSGSAGVKNRLNFLRQLGLLQDQPGIKRSQKCLVPSDSLTRDLGSILCKRYSGRLER